jgi:cyclase
MADTLDAGGATSYARPVRGDERRLSVEQRKVKRGVIIAKIRPGSEDKVAALFARSDETDLPELAGVVHRSLFVLDDVYVHYVETAEDFEAAVDQVREHPLFKEISRELDAYITPYNPETWRSPKDATAREFYSWDRDPDAD